MHINKIEKFAYMGAVMATITALAGCTGGSATAAATGQLEQTSITVDSVPVYEEAGLYVAAAQGFFAQQGLRVTVRPVTGGETAIPDLQSGHAELAAGNYVSFILAQLAGQFGGKPVNLRIIAAASALQPGSEALYVAPNSRFKTVAELARAHATIGLNTPNDVGDVLVASLLAQAGPYTLRDIKQVIPVQGFPALIKMLAAGKVDAVWLPNVLGDVAEQQVGAVQLADFDQGSLADLPFTGYIGSAAWVKAHPNTVAAFLRALSEGQQLADTDRSAVEQAMEKYTGIPAIIADTTPTNSYPLEMDVPQLQRVPDSMFQFGLTPGATAPYQITDMIQPEAGLIRN